MKKITAISLAMCMLITFGSCAADAPARKMAEFMLTEAGQICVENSGYGRLMK